MPNIELSNKIPSDIRPLILAAIEYFSKKLLHGKTLKKLNIFIDEISVSDKNAGYDGFCEWEIEYINPRDFAIYVNLEKNIGCIIETIAHEMIHIKQFVKNELKHRFYPERKIFWMGQEINTSNYRYDSLPWELEAWSNQFKLAEEFVHHYIRNLKI